MATCTDREDGNIVNSEVYVLGMTRKHCYPPKSPPTPSISPPESVGTQDILEDFDFCLSASQPNPEYGKTQEYLRHGLHVLNTEAQAMMNLKKIYEQDSSAQDAFVRSVETVCRQKATRSKVIVVGVGKSGHIGKKMTATFQSLGIRASFMHPTEALHGDLGFVEADDTILFVTYSGKTQELMSILPHLHQDQAIIVLTSHLRREACEIARQRPTAIVLPAPIIEPEAVSFGVSAPTTSTTVCLAVGDALAIAAAQALHQSVSGVFAKNHPGGAIGMAHRTPKKLEDIGVAWNDMSVLEGLTKESLGIDLFRASYNSDSRWIRFGDGIISKSRVGQLSAEYFNTSIGELSSLFIRNSDMILLPSQQDIQMAAYKLREMVSSSTEELGFVVGLIKDEELFGVVSTEKILSWPSL